MTGQEIPADTAHLGSFDPLEAPIVLDLLAEHGIFAFSKSPLDQAEGQPYGSIFGDAGRGRIFVDASRLSEARRIVEVELPERIGELQRALEAEFAEAFPEEQPGDEDLVVELEDDEEED